MMKNANQCFPLEHYNQHFALKVNFATILVIVFSLRSAFIAGLALASGENVTGITGYFYSRPLYFALSLIASLPVLVLCAAWIRRAPDAGWLPRFIWRGGRWVLLVVTSCDLAVVYWSMQARQLIPYVDVVQLSGGLVCLLYVLRSVRVKEIFRSFPEVPED